jgi:predicted nucleic acid-binding protein
MTAAVFVDTNVLVYLWDASDRPKRERALLWINALWDSQRGRTSVQVMNEFYVTVTRKLKPAVKPDAAQAFLRTLDVWSPVPTDMRLLEQAWIAQARRKLSFWDALIVSAAQTAQCRYLLSEDLADGQDLDGVLIVNPFKHEPSQIAPPR